MVFVRIKNIKSPCGVRYAYAYLCESNLVNGKVKQRVLRYLGKVDIGKITPLQVKKTFFKCAYRCVKCGAIEDLEIDHKIPLTLGGTNDDYNLQILCKWCNLKKGSKIHPSTKKVA